MANRFPLIFNSGAGQIQELAASDNLDLTSSNLVNAGILFTSSGSATAPSMSIGSGTTYPPGLYSPGTDQLAVATNGTGRMFVDASGNIGVGISSPAFGAIDHGVHIKGSSAQEGIRLETTNGSSGILEIYAENGGSTLDTRGSGYIRFNSATTEFGRWDSSGRLGIGTSSPALALHAKGASGYPAVSGTNQTGVFRVSGGTGLYNVLDMGVNESTDTAWIQATRANSLNTYDKLLINPYGGNVGIGTQSPTTKLDIYTGSATGTYVKVENTEGRLFAGVYGTGEGYLATETSDPLILGTNGTEKARLDTSGRLLVGTGTSPTVGDTQYGRIRTVGNTSASTGFGLASIGRGEAASAITVDEEIGYLTFTDNAGGAFAHIECRADGAANTSDYPGRLVFSSTADGASSPTERMRITSDGYMRMAASTGGIQFNGDTAAVNALDDYEEGTWTGAIATESGSNYTISAQTCQYVKVGNLVFVSFSITFTAEGSGTIAIISLPFTAATGSQLILNGFVTQGTDNRSIQYTNYTLSNVLPRVDSESYINYWSPNTNWSPTNTFIGTGCYRTA